MEVHVGGKGTEPNKLPAMPKNLMRNIIIGVVVLVVILLGSSTFYTVEEQEQAAILRFGQYVSTTESPGLHFKMPYPIEEAVIVPANLEQRIHIGYKDRGGEVVSVDEEALMITGDENIVSADAVVEWKVANLEQYLYNISDAQTFLRNSAISAIRSVIGSTKLDFAITDGKTAIQSDVKNKLIELQEQYETGIQIIDVKFQDIEPPVGKVQQAFKDVTNAREQRSTKINQAQKYVNDILPKARGEAQALLEQAEGEKQSRILNAQGDVAKFNAVYNEFVKNPNVTSHRLVLETFEKVLPGAKVIITDGAGDTVKYLPLNELLKSSGSSSSGGTSAPKATTPPPAAPSDSSEDAATEGGTQ